MNHVKSILSNPGFLEATETKRINWIKSFVIPLINIFIKYKVTKLPFKECQEPRGFRGNLMEFLSGSFGLRIEFMSYQMN